MRQITEIRAATPEQIVKDIRWASRKHHSAKEKIRIVLEGLRGEYSIAELCRREGIAESLYCSWSKEFLEAGKKRLAGDTARAATGGEVKDLRRAVRGMKVLVADLTLGKPPDPFKAVQWSAHGTFNNPECSSQEVADENVAPNLVLGGTYC